MGSGAYRLELPESLQCLHPVFPVVKLSPAPPDPYPGRRQPRPPEPILVDGEEHFTVEKILDSRIRYRRTEYLVKWEGYNDTHNQWVPYFNIQADKRIKEFHRLNPMALRQE